MATKAEMSNDELIDALPEETEGGAATGEAATTAADTGAAGTTTVADTTTEDPAKDAPAGDGKGETTTKTETTETPAGGAAKTASDGEGSSRESDNIRAARRAEKQANLRADRVQRELDRVLAEKNQPAKVEKPAADVLEDVRKYAPEVGVYVEKLEKQNEELSKKAQPAKKFAPEPIKDPDIESAILEVDELAEWHSNPAMQDRWMAAKAQDEVLARSSKWKDKPLVERFAHLVKKVNEEFGDEPAASAATPAPTKKAAPTAADAQRVIDETAKAETVGIGDVRGKSPPTGVTSKRAAWASMTNEELLAELPED